MPRLEKLALSFPEAERKDIEAWDGEPTFRVRGKNFVFTSPEATGITVKLPPEEAAALVASRESVTPTGYGLGRHGWVSIELGLDVSDAQWVEVEEWVEQSYRLVAPKTLVKQLDAK
ncbi:MAG: MmcQ/YjbR family DNA-binding protein [Nocardiaceae bacterium]|nr:MmcQ/YjbR family DNA-binding protein [Nocardiaceae bacterium]